MSKAIQLCLTFSVFHFSLFYIVTYLLFVSVIDGNNALIIKVYPTCRHS